MKFFKYLFALLFMLSLVSFAPGCGDAGEEEFSNEADDPVLSAAEGEEDAEDDEDEAEDEDEDEDE